MCPHLPTPQGFSISKEKNSAAPDKADPSRNPRGTPCADPAGVLGLEALENKHTPSPPCSSLNGVIYLWNNVAQQWECELRTEIRTWAKPNN